MTEALTGWAGDDTVRAVVLDGAGERGLCAGGDVVAIYAQRPRRRRREPASSGSTSTGSTR